MTLTQIAEETEQPYSHSSRAKPVKKLLPYAFLAGLVVSACSAVVFYYLLGHTPNPLLSTNYWKDTSVAEYASAYSGYSAWSATVSSYALAYGTSAVAAMGFAVGIAVYYFPKAALVASFAFLNLLFAWSSHVFWSVSVSVATALTNLMNAQDNFFWNLVDMPNVANATLVADAEALAMLTIIASLTFLYTYRKSKLKALFRSVQIVAGSSVILPAEILLCDGGEFNLHVTQVQSSFSYAVWFTNADMLYFGCAIFAAATLILNIPRLHQVAGPR